MRLISTISLALMLLTVQAQISIGYRNHAGNLTELNNIINQYNEARPWANKKLGRQNFMNGLEIGFEATSDNVNFSAMKIHLVRAKSSVRGTATEN